MSESFPPHCTCGCPLKGFYDVDSPHAWADYECGTDRAAPGAKPLWNGSQTDRSDLCRYIANLKRKAGLTKAQAVKLWVES